MRRDKAKGSKNIWSHITKIYLYNFHPVKPHFYIVKLLNLCSKNIDCGYSLEPPRRGGSNEYPQSMFLNRNMKNIRCFLFVCFFCFFLFCFFCFENFPFLVVKFPIYLKRHVFVMKKTRISQIGLRWA